MSSSPTGLSFPTQLGLFPTSFIHLLFCFLASVLFAACNKQHSEDDEKNLAVFTVISPAEGGVYNLTDSVPIVAKIAAAKGLHGYSIGLRSAIDTNQVFYFEHIHQHSDTVSIRMKWKGNLNQPSQLQLLLEALLDDNGTMARNTVRFIVQ